jgi:hypothetical protein
MLSLRPGSHGLRFSIKKESYRHSFLYLKGGSGSLNPPSVQILTSGAQAKPPPDLEIRRHTRNSEHTAPLGLPPAQGMRKERRRICTFLGHPSNGRTPQKEHTSNRSHLQPVTHEVRKHGWGISSYKRHRLGACERMASRRSPQDLNTPPKWKHAQDSKHASNRSRMRFGSWLGH